MLQQQQQQHPPPNHLPVPSWATKNAAGFHGNTSAGRIRLIDTALSLLQIPPFRRQPTKQQLTTPQRWTSYLPGAADHVNGNIVDVVVDVGIGDDPGTTIELALAVLGVDEHPVKSCTARNDDNVDVRVPNVLVIGTEVDVDRLGHAESVLLKIGQRAEVDSHDDRHIMERISLRRGTTDFTLPLMNNRDNLTSPRGSNSTLSHHLDQNHLHTTTLHQGVVKERPVLVRVMNVLRDYSVLDAITALRILYQQVAPGGYLVEGSAETNGRVAMALLWHRPPPQLPVEEDQSDDDDEIFMNAVIFGVDLATLVLDPDYCDSAPPEWFNRHNHLPRLYRGFCDAADCSWDSSPAWAIPMRSFLERWKDADNSVTADGVANNNHDQDILRSSITERFVRGAAQLKVAQEEITTGRMLVDWADQGILVWFPGENELVLPDMEEWFYFRQRTIR